jgi:hypothetical protein
LGEGLERLWEKIKALLPKKALDYFAELVEKFYLTYFLDRYNVTIIKECGMALKGNLAEAGELLEDITSEFHKLKEFVSKPDLIETAKEQARITGLTNLTKFFY